MIIALLFTVIVVIAINNTISIITIINITMLRYYYICNTTNNSNIFC